MKIHKGIKNIRKTNAHVTHWTIDLTLSSFTQTTLSFILTTFWPMTNIIIANTWYRDRSGSVVASLPSRLYFDEWWTIADFFSLTKVDGIWGVKFKRLILCFFRNFKFSTVTSVQEPSNEITFSSTIFLFWNWCYITLSTYLTNQHLPPIYCNPL